MNTIPDLVSLHDTRPGLRSLLHVEVREAVPVVETESGSVSSEALQATLDFVASTATLDRYQEVIEPSGWRLDSYRRNPVFQNAHNYGDVLFTLGKALWTDVRAVDGREALCQRIQFATEVNPVARIAYGLYRGGFLNAVSVGFIPLKWEDANGKNGNDGTNGISPRRRFLEQELLEVSAVAIPANPDALALGVKSGAVSREDLKETAELLKALMANSEPALTPTLSPKVGLPLREREKKPEPPGIGGYSYLDFARELRRILRNA